MNKSRLEAFSDGVIAILITIMILGLRTPAGVDFSDLAPLLPQLLAYILSFVVLGIYWNNHHHMLHAATRVKDRRRQQHGRSLRVCIVQRKAASARAAAGNAAPDCGRISDASERP